MASSNIEEISDKELKEEVQKLTLEIIGFNQEESDGNESDQSDHGVITINKAIQALTSLKELNLKKRKRSLSSLYDHFDVPSEFRCPISTEIMKDPVVFASGQTYERPFIRKWLKDVHRTCPQTRQVISQVVLTPNHLVRELIQQWCKDHNMHEQIQSPAKEVEDKVIVAIADVDQDHLKGLLTKLSTSTLSDQKQAANEIRLLTKSKPSVRPFFGKSTDSIPQLLSPLTQSGNIDNHPGLQEDLVTVLLNISIADENKKIIGEHPLVIPLLVESLTRGNINTRSNAAAALFTLSSLDSNKILIGEASALKPLADLLAERVEHPSAMKDAATAIYQLCKLEVNRKRAIGGGTIRVILRKLKDGAVDQELFTILAMLATHKAGLEELVELGAERRFLGVIREGSTELNEENCIAILYLMCAKNRDVLKEVRNEETVHGTISKLAEHGTSRTKRKASSLLTRFR